MVERLLKLGFDVDYQNYEGLTAIDIAWNECKADKCENFESFNKIILILLNFDSKLPQKGFNLENLSQDIQKFVTENETLCSLIENNNVNLLMRRIKQNQNLRYFYDRNNQSLIAYAINKNKSNIVNKLVMKPITLHGNIHTIL